MVSLSAAVDVLPAKRPRDGKRRDDRIFHARDELHIHPAVGYLNIFEGAVQGAVLTDAGKNIEVLQHGLALEFHIEDALA